MFESEVRIERDRLLHLFEHFSQRISIQEILSHPHLDAPYKQFLLGEVDWWVYQQRLMHENSQYFDFHHPEFKEILEQYFRLCRKYAIFQLPVLRELIELAVKTRVNYLIRPQVTLRWFIFRGKPTQFVSEVLLRLNYFSEYQYLIKGIQQRLESYGNQLNRVIAVNEFERIIQEIEQDELLDYTPAQFLELLEPLREFFVKIHRSISDESTYGIPIDALIVFLYDKSINPLAEKLIEFKEESREKYITEKAFLAIIQDVLEEIEKPEEHTLPLDFTEEQQSESAVTQQDVAKHVHPEKPKSSEDEGHRDSDTVENFTNSEKSYSGTIGERQTPAETAEQGKQEHDLSVVSDKDDTEGKGENFPQISTAEDDGEAEESTSILVIEEQYGDSEQLSENEPAVPSIPPSEDSGEPSVYGEREEQIDADLGADSGSTSSEKIDLSFYPWSEDASKLRHPFMDLLSGAYSSGVYEEQQTSEWSAYLSEKLQQRIVEKLFAGDRQAWEAFMEQLRAVRSWKEFNVVLDRLLIEKNIPPDEDVVEKLREAAKGRFASLL